MKLPFVLDVPIKGYQHHAYALGVLFAIDLHAEIWIHNYCVQLQYNESNYRCKFNFYRGEVEFPHQYFESEYISRNTLDDLGVPIADFIRTKLDNKYYIKLDLDEYYIPNRMQFNKEHYWHDVLVYGYEDDIFDISGYDEHMQYCTSTINIEELQNAFGSSYSVVQSGITSFRKKVGGRAFEIDIDLICDQLYDYINSENTANRYKYYDLSGENKVFGLRACESLLGLLQEISVDVRPFYILWEHKKCMLARIQYLYEQGYIINGKRELERYREVVDKALIIRNGVLRANIKKKKEGLGNLRNKLMELMQIESGILIDFLQDIESNRYGKNNIE